MVIPSKASYFIFGRAGVNFILPEPNTPCETVTIQAFALIVPSFVSTFTPLPSHFISFAIVFTLTGTSFLS